MEGRGVAGLLLRAAVTVAQRLPRLPNLASGIVEEEAQARAETRLCRGG